MFGLDLEPSPHDPTSSENKALQFVPIFGGRNLALGLATYVFYWRRMFRAMGVLLLCCMAAVIVDTVATGFGGMKGKAWTHGIGTVVMGLSGWGLLV